MMRNVAGQSTLIGPLELVTDGSAVTAGATVTTRVAGVTAAGAGTLVHVAAGVWEYAPTQAETDTPTLGLILQATGARAVPLTVETTRLPVQTAAGAAGGLPVLDGLAGLDVNIVSIAGDGQAARNLRDDELAPAPIVPTAAAIRAEIDTESVQLQALRAGVVLAPAQPGYAPARPGDQVALTPAAQAAVAAAIGAVGLASGTVQAGALPTAVAVVGTNLLATPGTYAGRRLYVASGPHATFLSDPCSTHLVAGSGPAAIHTFGFAAVQDHVLSPQDVVVVVGP